MSKLDRSLSDRVKATRLKTDSRAGLHLRARNYKHKVHYAPSTQIGANAGSGFDSDCGLSGEGHEKAHSLYEIEKAYPESQRILEIVSRCSESIASLSEPRDVPTELDIIKSILEVSVLAFNRVVQRLKQRLTDALVLYRWSADGSS